jgi:hypothetical protein
LEWAGAVTEKGLLGFAARGGRGIGIDCNAANTG